MSRIYEHESSYKGFSLASFVHRQRLKTIKSLFEQVELSETGKLADFGCSNGFIIRQMKSTVFKDKKWHFYGYDHNKELIEIADNLNTKECTFNYFDMNTNKIEDNKFDIVTCFETIEHVGKWKNGLEALIASCMKNGIIIISVPNEKRIQGLIKYLSRKLVRRNPYRDFFENRNCEIKYFYTLLKNGEIDSFRKPALGYGPHLGYDWEKMYSYINKKYIKKGILEEELLTGSFASFNKHILLKKM